MQCFIFIQLLNMNNNNNNKCRICNNNSNNNFCIFNLFYFFSHLISSHVWLRMGVCPFRFVSSWLFVCFVFSNFNLKYVNNFICHPVRLYVGVLTLNICSTVRIRAQYLRVTTILIVPLPPLYMNRWVYVLVLRFQICKFNSEFLWVVCTQIVIREYNQTDWHIYSCIQMNIH